MKIVYMGTPEFAVPSMEILAKHHEMVGVITAPDKPAGRGKKLKSSAIKLRALELGLHIMQPTNLKDADFQSELAALGADLFVVVAFRMLPESVWAMPAKGTINLHGSLLPQYRGAAPINRAIMNGEKETGLTTFFIEKQIDTGKVIQRKSVAIGPDDTAGILHDAMMQVGSTLLLDSVTLIAQGNVKGEPQSNLAEGTALKEAPKIFREDCQINWDLSAQSIHDHIRGLSPFPAAWTKAHSETLGEETYKIRLSKFHPGRESKPSGSIEIKDGNLHVYAAGGTLEILEIQAPGKKSLKAVDFLRGFKIPAGFKFLS